MAGRRRRRREPGCDGGRLAHGQCCLPRPCAEDPGWCAASAAECADRWVLGTRPRKAGWDRERVKDLRAPSPAAAPRAGGEVGRSAGREPVAPCVCVGVSAPDAVVRSAMGALQGLPPSGIVRPGAGVPSRRLVWPLRAPDDAPVTEAGGRRRNPARSGGGGPCVAWWRAPRARYVQTMRTGSRTLNAARRLRREMSPPEVRLWLRLRAVADSSPRVRRQHPMGPYVLDFYYPQAKLCVEVDAPRTGWATRRPGTRNAMLGWRRAGWPR